MSEKFFNLIGNYHNKVEPMPYVFIVLALLIMWFLFQKTSIKTQ